MVQKLCLIYTSPEICTLQLAAPKSGKALFSDGRLLKLTEIYQDLRVPQLANTYFVAVHVKRPRRDTFILMIAL